MKINKLTFLVGRRNSGQVEWVYDQFKEMFLVNKILGKSNFIKKNQNKFTFNNILFIKDTMTEEQSFISLKNFINRYSRRINYSWVDIDEIIIELPTYKNINEFDLADFMFQFGCPIKIIKFDISEEDYCFNTKYLTYHKDFFSPSFHEIKLINNNLCTNIEFEHVTLTKKDPYYLFLDKYELYSTDTRGSHYKKYDNLFGNRWIELVDYEYNDKLQIKKLLEAKKKTFEKFNINKYGLEKEATKLIKKFDVMFNLYCIEVIDLYDLLKDKFIEEEYGEQL